MDQLYRQYKPTGGAAELLAAETTHELLPAPGASKKLCITTLFVSVVVSAAQIVTIQSADGTVKLAVIGASPGVTQFPVPLPPQGVDLPENQALNIIAALAGPRVFARVGAVIKS